MTEQQKHLGDVQSVKLAISRLDGLAMLPTVATEVFTQMSEANFSPVALADTARISPALTVKILSLAHGLGIKVADHGFSFSRLLERLPADALRNALLETDLWDSEHEVTCEETGLSRLAFVTHSLAVAQVSKRIAQAMVVGTDVNLAFMVGLMHDIGKLALQELMPKGLGAIVSQAKASGIGSCALEREYLGLDHATLGKYLARKWGFPPQVVTGIWLHHSPMSGLGERQPGAGVAQIVFCADCLVRSLEVGVSGSIDRVPGMDDLARLVRVEASRLQKIAEQFLASPDLEAHVSQLNAPVPCRQVVRATQRLALRLGQTESRQAQENSRLHQKSQELEFVHGLCGSVDARLEPAEFCVQWAKQWQRFFQTSKVCLFLAPDVHERFVEVTVLSGLMDCRSVLLDNPDYSELIPRTLATQEGIHTVQDAFDWLFSQLDVDFNPAQTRFTPLLFDHDLLGGLLFELNYPMDTSEHRALFVHLARVGATLLHAILARRHQEALCDEMVGCKPEPQTQDEPEQDRLIRATAEMAAGLAHELNNPLSVIAGRVQLLAGDEDDPDKLRVLRQIQENVHEASVVLDDLISYAEPSTPRASHVSVGQVIDEAIQLAQHKSGRDDWNVSIHLEQDVDQVFVDSAQIASALANVLVNGVEAYRDTIDAIEINAKQMGTHGYVELQVCDHGCGMDQDTLHKATMPFFSAKPAGRQRGMGLAYAIRIVELNRGRLTITSRMEEGTIVTFMLPVGPRNG